MLARFPSLAAVVSVALGVSDPSSTEERYSLGDQVAIRISGEVATRYLQATGVPQATEPSNENSSLTVAGVVHAVDGRSVQVHHRTIVRKVGETVRIVTLRSTVGVSQLSAASPDMSDSGTRLQTEVSDPKTVEIRSSLLRGGFPTALSNRSVLR